ncbi:preprotein translocase subunit YajC [Luteipulveratus sp. YIM 133132]|uniref:Preprotein translocase subunit YajC n=1 Tax=Luteipulveratus flavus TaxID=3031728 RepID=A0ABT6CBK4_9MICO|nr:MULTISPECIES: preprotein translocase subunit YajC [unclassified Luteipulveratus]MDE9367328.1 preprotein translocase subunit YajC [Luteipulveratus sp. YIM 133132]MDF8266288.1 preprotein translocase subunit YajC [Luteipulveratus sp. YIM 133296]
MPSLATAASQGGSAASLLILLLPVLLIALMFWTQRRRNRQFQQAQAELRIGDEVATTSGLLGRLVALDEQAGSIEAAPGVVLRFDRRAIVPPTVASAAAEPSDAPAEAETERPSTQDDSDSTGEGSTPRQGS